MLSRQRLAGFVNFVRPCLKLPLGVVSAVLDGDPGSGAAVAPFIRDGVSLTFSDICRWNDDHGKHIFVDATPTQIGIVQQGCEPVSIALPVALPIYEAEYLAALTAVLSRDMSDTVLHSDNLGVVYNLHKGRCPRQWLSILLFVFMFRNFSVRYISTAANPADAASRDFGALCEHQ